VKIKTMILTKIDKVKLVQALSTAHKAKLRKHLREHTMAGKGMSGKGFVDFLKKVGNFLAPIVKTVGPTILKEVLLPLAKSKMGLGLKPSGGGLRLAGQRRAMK
jgi:hypothetical protein